MKNETETNFYIKSSVALVDDHEVVLEGMCAFLQKNDYPDVHVFRSAGELLLSLHDRHFGMYIIDLELPDMEGTAFIDRLRACHADARIIINTMHEEMWVVKAMINKDVNGVIYKSADLSQLLVALRHVEQGEKYYCEKFSKILARVNTMTEVPSPREREVLYAIAKGLSTREIAAQLYISENTVESHRQSLFAKLQAHNMADLMVKAIARGYINPQKID